MKMNNELKTVKEFNHPAEKVYAAWTEPEQLKQWWQPMNAKLTQVKNDLNVGGEIEYQFSTEGEEGFNVTGTYSEVVPNERLVYSWVWQLRQNEKEDYQLSVDFASTESGCRLEVRQENFRMQEQLEPHREGWEQGLSSLASYLDRSGTSKPAGTIEDHIPVVDYGEEQ
jgi:uncharacterized protein YndB with AHSA1/START domain